MRSHLAQNSPLTKKYSGFKNILVCPTHTGIYPRGVQFLNDRVVRVAVEISLSPLTKKYLETLAVIAKQVRAIQARTIWSFKN